MYKFVERGFIDPSYVALCSEKLKYIIPEATTKKKEIGTLNYYFKLDIRIKEFKEFINLAYKFKESVKLSFSEHFLRLSCESELIKLNCQIPILDNGNKQYNSDESVIISTQYLKEFMRSIDNKRLSEFSLFIRSDYPLMIQYQYLDKKEKDFIIISPRIEDY